VPDNPTPRVASDTPSDAPAGPGAAPSRRIGTGGSGASGAPGDEASARAGSAAAAERAEGTAPTLPPSAASAASRNGVAAQRRERRAKTRQRAVAEWVVAIGLAVLAAFVIKTWIVQAFVIPSGSMEPTLQVGDRVLVEKFAYHFSDIHRDDVIVFKNPDRLPGEPAQLIKRVVGVGGDVIQTVDGKLVVNGQAVSEPVLEPGTRTISPDGRDMAPTPVPDGYVFVMGDNRTNSRDSRYIGPIDVHRVVGKAFFRIWPLNRLGTL
jgi:signal peptidase I